MNFQQLRLEQQPSPCQKEANQLFDLPGYEVFDPEIHELWMTKPIYGLKDAPRAWRQGLNQILIALKGKALVCGSSLKCWYENTSKGPRLILMASAHVDDLKITGSKTAIEQLLSALTSTFGSVKIHWKVFEHCGIHHIQQSDYSVVTHQNHYAQTLHPINATSVDITKPDVPLEYALRCLFLSLLGGLAWLTQTRLSKHDSINRQSKHVMVTLDCMAVLYGHCECYLKFRDL